MPPSWFAFEAQRGMGPGPDFIKNREHDDSVFRTFTNKSDVCDFVVSPSVTALPIKKFY